MNFGAAPLTPVRPAFLTRVTPVARLVAGMTWLIACDRDAGPGRAGSPDDRRGRRPGAVVRAAAAAHPRPPVAARPGHPEPDRLLDPAGGRQRRPVAGGARRNSGPSASPAPAVSAGLAVGLRVVVIGLTTLLVFGPSDPTRMADSLVQQWRFPDRFAYGTLAALRVAPFMADDWTMIGAARRLRGIRAARPSPGGSATPAIGCWSCSSPPSGGPSGWPWPWTPAASTAACGAATSASCASRGAIG